MNPWDYNSYVVSVKNNITKEAKLFRKFSLVNKEKVLIQWNVFEKSQCLERTRIIWPTFEFFL